MLAVGGAPCDPCDGGPGASCDAGLQCIAVEVAASLDLCRSSQPSSLVSFQPRTCCNFQLPFRWLGVINYRLFALFFFFFPPKSKSTFGTHCGFRSVRLKSLYVKVCNLRVKLGEIWQKKCEKKAENVFDLPHRQDKEFLGVVVRRGICDEPPGRVVGRTGQVAVREQRQSKPARRRAEGGVSIYLFFQRICCLWSLLHPGAPSPFCSTKDIVAFGASRGIWRDHVGSM